MIVKVILSPEQVTQCAYAIESQGKKADRAIFAIVTKSYDPRKDEQVSVQFCAVNWRAGQKIIRLLKKEELEPMNDLSILVSRGKITRARKGIIYGVEGIGKTTFAAKLPSPVIIDTERGTDDLDVPRIKVSTPEEWENAVTSLLKQPHEFKTVVVDTLDWLEKILATKVCKAHNKESIEDFGYGKGFTILREEFDKLLFRLDQFIEKGISVVFIAHSQVKRIQPPEATDGYDRYQLKLDQRNAEKAKEWADFVLFVNWLTNVKENAVGKTTATGGRERRIHTVHTAAYDAKNRVGLGEKLPFEIESVAPLFGYLNGSAPKTEPTPEPTIAGDFIAAVAPVTGPALYEFMTERGYLKEGQSLLDVPEAVMKRALANPQGFKKVIEDYANAKSQVPAQQP